MSSKLTYLCNIYDPSANDFADKVVHAKYGKRAKMTKEAQLKLDSSYHGPVSKAPSKESAVKFVQDWLKYKQIGEPQAPRFSSLSVDELKALGYVGVYTSGAMQQTKANDTHAAQNIGERYPKKIKYDPLTGKNISLDPAFDAREAEKAKRTANRLKELAKRKAVA